MTLLCVPSLNSVIVSFKRSGLRPVIIKEAPALAHSIATLRPIPEEAPVIKTVLFFNEKGSFMLI